MVVDIENAEVGRMKLMERQAPDFRLIAIHSGVLFPAMPREKEFCRQAAVPARVLVRNAVAGQIGGRIAINPGVSI